MIWKFIVPTRTCRVCSLLCFDGKRWCFSRLSGSSSPLPFLGRSFFQQVRTLCVHTMTGPSHAACNTGRVARLAALLYHCNEDFPLNCCNCSAAGHAQGLEWVRRQLDPPTTFSSILSQNVQLSTNDGASARRVSSATCTTGARSLQPQIHLLHLPQHLSHLAARETDNDDVKQQKRKIEDNSNCSQPPACAQASHPVFNQARERPACTSSAPCVQTGEGKAGSSLTRMESSLSSIKQAPFFHCTIARLAAAHTFLMAEISRHALTDLSSMYDFRQKKIFTIENYLLVRIKKKKKTLDSTCFTPRSRPCTNWSGRCMYGFGEIEPKVWVPP